MSIRRQQFMEGVAERWYPSPMLRPVRASGQAHGIVGVVNQASRDAGETDRLYVPVTMDRPRGGQDSITRQRQATFGWICQPWRRQPRWSGAG
jgi:hypothetical protein